MMRMGFPSPAWSFGIFRKKVLTRLKASSKFRTFTSI
jgi:hypothetical protein